jgi:hypothetical protein
LGFLAAANDVSVAARKGISAAAANMLIALLMAISSDRGFADFGAADFNPPSSTFSIGQIHPARYEYPTKCSVIRSRLI